MTVQGPVKKPQPDGMSHGGGGGRRWFTGLSSDGTPVCYLNAMAYVAESGGHWRPGDPPLWCPMGYFGLFGATQRRVTVAWKVFSPSSPVLAEGERQGAVEGGTNSASQHNHRLSAAPAPAPAKHVNMLH